MSGFFRIPRAAMNRRLSGLTNNQQPTTNNQQPNNQQPTTNNHQPTTTNQQLKTNNPITKLFSTFVTMSNCIQNTDSYEILQKRTLV